MTSCLARRKVDQKFCYLEANTECYWCYVALCPAHTHFRDEVLNGHKISRVCCPDCANGFDQRKGAENYYPDPKDNY